MCALPEATSSNESNALTRSPEAKYCTFSRPSDMSVSRWAKACALVPSAGKSRPQVLTMTTSWRPCEIAGAATVAAATPAVPTAAFFRKLRRLMPCLACFLVCFIDLPPCRWCESELPTHRILPNTGVAEARVQESKPDLRTAIRDSQSGYAALLVIVRRFSLPDQLQRRAMCPTPSSIAASTGPAPLLPGSAPPSREGRRGSSAPGTPERSHPR